MEQPHKRSPRAVSAAESSDLLFEIGTEELPYRFVAPALSAFEQAADRLLKEHRLSYGALRTFGTPRRLTLVVESLARQQQPVVAEVMGPSKAVAFDGAGRPTRAAIGFAASQNVAVEELQVRQTPKGEYVFALKHHSGRSTELVLAEALPALVGSLPFPKSMRWDASGMKFARPIRWLVAVYNGDVVNVQIGNVRAGNRTWGHRVIGASLLSKKQGLVVYDLKSYLKILERHGVIPEPQKRRAIVRAQLDDLARSAGGTWYPDEELLEQAVYSVEYPQTILGAFGPQYLALPKEILMTAMKEHQGFFALMSREGSLQPAFLSVTNMKLVDMRLIREGNERVLAARLADAQFFFNEDRKTSLAERVTRLAGVTFHQKLGTLYQKQERVVKLVAALASQLSSDDETLKQTCMRAARLSKADLVTGMVGEFPTLQGIMGAEYARHDGETEEVSRAIREQYLPPSMEGDLPQTRAGTILSLADRLDTIAAFFSAGIVPTGSEDPYALRRHATAVVRILLEGNLHLNLAETITCAANLVFDDKFPAAGQATGIRQAILNFLFDRMRHYGRTVHGLRNDVMEAVLRPAADGSCDLVDLLVRMQVLQAFTTQAEFEPLMVGFKRAHRIIEKEQWARDSVDPELFQDSSEAELHKMLAEGTAQVPGAIARRDYRAALDALVRMKSAIDGFFNSVLVNAEDQRLRGNRLSLLDGVDRLFLSVADFSQILV